MTTQPFTSTDQLWADYVRYGSVLKVARLHGTTHSNIVQRLHNAGYTLGRPGPKRHAHDVRESR